MTQSGGITPERFLGWLRKPPTLSDGRSVAPGSSNLAGSDALIETTHLKVSPAEVKKAIEQHKPWLNVGEIKKGISEALEEIPTTGEFSRSQRSKIESLFRKASPWDTVERSGESAVPSSDPTKQFQRLRDLCKEMGVWIVPVGELEGFCKSVGSKGPRWVQQVIEKHSLADDPELDRTRAFVRKIWERGVPAKAECCRRI